MTKVAVKIFAIIEYIAARDGAPVLPNDLVKAMGINQATCIRILKELVQVGYLEQISRQHGYVIGPMANWLSRHARYRKELLDLAEPLVADLARAEKQSVLVATLHEGRRFILCHHNFNPDIHADVEGPWFDDLYVTATGQVLLAHADGATQKAVVKRMGWPKSGPWNGLSKWGELEKEFHRIRQTGHVAMEGTRTGLFIIAYPLWQGDAVDGALGISIPLTEASSALKTRLIQRLGDLARSIQKSRRSSSTVG